VIKNPGEAKKKFASKLGLRRNVFQSKIIAHEAKKRVYDTILEQVNIIQKKKILNDGSVCSIVSNHPDRSKLPPNKTIPKNPNLTTAEYIH
jgi:hypothetical protein